MPSKYISLSLVQAAFQELFLYLAAFTPAVFPQPGGAKETYEYIDLETRVQ